METKAAVRALAALAQESRVRIFRMLVRAGDQGLAAGALAERAGLPASTLSFHLHQLSLAGLVRSERHGRSLIYSLQADRFRELIWFLGEDCLQGRADLCAPLTDRIDARLREAESADRPAVVFVCAQNSARSQLAEALLRRAAGDRFDSYSGGIRPAEIHPLTLRVLDEIEVDTTGLHSKDLGQLLGKVPIQYAIAVCETTAEECERLHPFARQMLHWPFPDPVGAVAGDATESDQLDLFREVRDGLDARIQDWLRTGPRIDAQLR